MDDRHEFVMETQTSERLASTAGYSSPSLVPRLSDRMKATKGWGEEEAAANESLVSTVCGFYVSLHSHRHNDHFFVFYCVVVIAMTSCRSERQVAFSLAGLLPPCVQGQAVQLRCSCPDI